MGTSRAGANSRQRVAQADRLTGDDGSGGIETKRNKTMNALHYMVPSKTSFETAWMESRTWCGRGCRVEAMCKNSHCSPFPRTACSMHTAPVAGGGPAHSSCNLFGKWAPLEILGN